MMKLLRVTLSNLRISKRSVSPAVSVVFLMGIFAGAIGASTIIIIPNIQRITDEGTISKAESNLKTLDEIIQDIIIQELDTTTKVTLDSGSGIIFLDNKSTIRIIPEITEQNLPTSYITTIDYNRIIINAPLQTEYLKVGEHFYADEQSENSLFSLNSSTSKTSQLRVINTSRNSGELSIQSALSYKLVFENSFPNQQEVITNIKIFKFNLIGKSQDLLSNNALSLKFNSVTTTNIFSKHSNLEGDTATINIDVTLQNENVFRENPFTLKRGYYFWTLNLVQYEIDIEL